MLVTCFLHHKRFDFIYGHVRRFCDYSKPISLVAASARTYYGRFNGPIPVTFPSLILHSSNIRVPFLHLLTHISGSFTNPTFFTPQISRNGCCNDYIRLRLIYNILAITAITRLVLVSLIKGRNCRNVTASVLIRQVSVRSLSNVPLGPVRPSTENRVLL